MLRLITFALCHVIIFKCAIIKLIYWFQKLNTSRQSLYDHNYSFHCIVKLCWNSNRFSTGMILCSCIIQWRIIWGSSLNRFLYFYTLPVALIISSSCFKHSIMISVSHPPLFLLHTVGIPRAGWWEQLPWRHSHCNNCLELGLKKVFLGRSMYPWHVLEFLVHDVNKKLTNFIQFNYSFQSSIKLYLLIAYTQRKWLLMCWPLVHQC